MPPRSFSHLRLGRGGLPTAALLILTLLGCTSVPFDRPKNESHAYTEVADTTLGRAAARWSEQYEGRSGFYPLSEGMDALGVRLQLADLAEKSIDLQYFLMKEDDAGAVVTLALLRAADRGVRVRFLLDDIFTTAPDRGLLLLNEHPNIEVRLFNPISRRGWSALNFAAGFRQANRRMHNKSFTVDNSASIVGGRNIADEYYQLRDDAVFVDFDVIALGPVVADVSASFDEFWNHSRAVPIEYISKLRRGESLEKIREESQEQVEEVFTGTYSRALERPLVADLTSGRSALFPARAQVLTDSPEKLVRRISRSNRQLARDLGTVLESAETEIIFISPYYVPGSRGIRFLEGLCDRGIRVVILTNSLASNNHIAVHSGYSRYRTDVLEAGAELYEARANAARELTGGDEGPETLTLHTKAILIDRRYLFVGSLNLDPRSIEINAEMGLLIDCPDMIETWAAALPEVLERLSYRVLRDDRGRLEWHGTVDGERQVLDEEPLTSWWRRFQCWFLRIAPESQL